jgi:hypothetical protein
MSKNRFPEGHGEKHALRMSDLPVIHELRRDLGQQLNYLGLPAADMRDVIAWREDLGEVVAIERDADAAKHMLQTANRYRLRERLTIVEATLTEYSRLLKDRSGVSGILRGLSPHEQARVLRTTLMPYHVINFDLYGGFLYSNLQHEAPLAEALKTILDHQRSHKALFLLILTLELRDKGAKYYKRWIQDTCDDLEKAERRTLPELREYYLGSSGTLPQHARFLSFCVPLFLHKEAWARLFTTELIGHWLYKRQYYHAVLKFRYQDDNPIGFGKWPPIDETKSILQKGLFEMLPSGKLLLHAPPME